MRSNINKPCQGNYPLKPDKPAKAPAVYKVGNGLLVADVYCASDQNETFWRVEVGFSEMPTRGTQFRWKDSEWEIVGSSGFGFIATPLSESIPDDDSRPGTGVPVDRAAGNGGGW